MTQFWGFLSLDVQAFWMGCERRNAVAESVSTLRIQSRPTKSSYAVLKSRLSAVPYGFCMIFYNLSRTRQAGFDSLAEISEVSMNEKFVHQVTK